MDIAGGTPPQQRRPNPGQWLRYLFGAGLPAELRDWVLRDTTSPTWALRHAVRWLVRMAPFAVAMLVIPVSTIGVRVAVVVVALALGLFYSFAFVVETSDRRLVKAGYPPGYAERCRARRDR